MIQGVNHRTKGLPLLQGGEPLKAAGGGNTLKGMQHGDGSFRCTQQGENAGSLPVIIYSAFFTFGTWYSYVPPKSNFTLSGGVSSNSGWSIYFTMDAKNAA